MNESPHQLDALIFGGGIAGLWLLDELHRRSYRAMLIERRALGSGQTITSQGILHGGLKYALGGLLSGAAGAAAEMTDRWRECLAGRAEPDLRGVRIASPGCHLWRTDALASRVGLTAAKIGLRTPVTTLARTERPAALTGCPGEVLCVEEQVLDVSSLLHELAQRHAPRILCPPNACEPAFVVSSPGRVDGVSLRLAPSDVPLSLQPTVTILTAGEGNADLRRRLGLVEPVMQLRPLHMVMVRGTLPSLFGHCIDGNKTRVTITSALDLAGRTVWHVGGELAERGVEQSPADLLTHARKELPAVLPGVDFSNTEWATYRIQRAEGRNPRGTRPDGPVWRRESSVITAWPTKLVLAPRLAEQVTDSLGKPRFAGSPDERLESCLARMTTAPRIADPPWEVTDQWHR